MQENKKAQIIESAILIFANEGFDKPSMEYISKTVGVSKRTLYKHFSNKNEILNEIIPFLVSKSFDSFKLDTIKDKEPIEQLMAIIERKIATILDHDNLNISKILIGEILKGNRSLTKTINEVYVKEQVVHDWFILMQKQSFISKEYSTIELANTLNDLTLGIVLFPFLIREREPQEHDSRSIAEHFMIFAKVKA